MSHVTESCGNWSHEILDRGSGSRPTSRAYERTNARVEDPTGSRAMSFRSRASRVIIEIFVRGDLTQREAARSRARRSEPPKSRTLAVQPSLWGNLGLC